MKSAISIFDDYKYLVIYEYYFIIFMVDEKVFEKCQIFNKIKCPSSYIFHFFI
jgi:hypothetical protein